MLRQQFSPPNPLLLWFKSPYLSFGAFGVYLYIKIQALQIQALVDHLSKYVLGVLNAALSSLLKSLLQNPAMSTLQIVVLTSL